MGRVPLFALKVEVPEEEGSENGLEGLEKSDLKFSAGNPRIERVSGTVRLFAQRPSSDSNDTAPHDLPRKLPPGRGSTVCVLAVPPRMSASEFCSFVGAILSQVEELRFLRDASPSSTSSAFLALLKFSSQDAADSFHAFYHGKRFHSLQPDLCSVLFVSHIAIEHSSNVPPLPDSLSEVPSCPVCLERLDESSGGVVTTVCSHSFHSSCLVQWNDASCPVCRYCHSPPEPPQCTTCGSTEDVWICLICGSVGCGRYSHAHAKEHWLQTSHCYSMELPTKRVWDYVGDTYVHRLLQSKAGQFVEVEPDNDDTAATTAFGNERDTCGGASSSISGTSKWQQAVLSSKTDAIAWEYNQLLTSQLESQRQYFEELLQETQQSSRHSSQYGQHRSHMRSGQRRSTNEVEASTSASTKNGESSNNNTRVSELQQRLKAAEEERDSAKCMNDSLLSNQREYQQRIANLEKQLEDVSQEKNKQICDLEEQVRDLMTYIEAGKAVSLGSGCAAEARDGIAFSLSAPSAAKSASESNSTGGSAAESGGSGTSSGYASKQRGRTGRRR